jgi:hypothetical protein
MSGTTSVPQPTFGPVGFIAPAQADILTGRLSDIQAAFGNGLNPDLTTPQGQMATSDAAIIGDVNSQFTYLTNQMDPAYATGRMQDGIARIYFLTRNPAQATVVTGRCYGAAGVVIPVNAKATATDGNTYLSTSSGTIGLAGYVDLPFVCTATGPIVCGIGALNAIYQTILGWDSITNLAAGVLGNVVESRAAFEARRSASVALNGQSALTNLRAAVLAVAGVLDAYVTENSTGSSVTIGGVSIAAHAIYIAVSGGTSVAVAQAIWTKKPPGVGMVGNTTVTVTDTNYSVPMPAYAITYQTPTGTPIYFAVSIANTTSVPSNALALIQVAIIAAFSGADGGQRAAIGATIFASRFYSGIATLGAWASIVSVFIGASASPTGNFVTMTISQVPTIANSQITLALV